MTIMAAGALLLASAQTAIGATQPTPVQSGTLRLAPEQMFALAQLAQEKGDHTVEFAIYAALERNPDPDIRAEARFRHAKQLLALKRNREAAVLLRRVVDEKPNAVAARLELAHTLQLLGDTNGALRELRAAQAIGLPPEVARLVDRYSAALRSQRPSGASLEVALAPNSNINGATHSNTLGTVFGDFQIDDDGKAKSGIGLALDAQAFRRFALIGDTTLLVRFAALANLYRWARFNDVAADVAVGPELGVGRGRLQIEIGATQHWYGQKPYIRSERLGATFSRPLGSRTLLRLTGMAAVVDNRFNDLQDGNRYSGRLQVERAITSTTGLAGSISVDREDSKDPAYATTGWRTELTGWHDVGRTTLTASGEIGRLGADARLLLFPDRRKDRYARLSFGASFRQVEYAGFAPELRFSVERNRSSIAVYDYRRTRAEMAIVRAF